MKTWHVPCRCVVTTRNVCLRPSVSVSISSHTTRSYRITESEFSQVCQCLRCAKQIFWSTQHSTGRLLLNFWNCSKFLSALGKTDKHLILLWISLILWRLGINRLVDYRHYFILETHARSIHIPFVSMYVYVCTCVCARARVTLILYIISLYKYVDRSPAHTYTHFFTWKHGLNTAVFNRGPLLSKDLINFN